MKRIFKRAAEGLALLAILPILAFYLMGRAVLDPEKAFSGWSQFVSLFPGLTGAYLRRAFYRVVFLNCGPDSMISFGTVFSSPHCRIGRQVYIGVFCCMGEITLGDDVLIGSHVSIMNGSAQHGIDRLDIPVREQPGDWPHIMIGDDSWIGDRAIVMANVGKHCVIGAGSVVTKAIPDYAIAMGSPARIVRYRNAIESSERTGNPVSLSDVN